MGRSQLDGVEESPRHVTGQRRVGARFREVRTTKVLPAVEGCSRGGSGCSERLEIAPLVGFIDGMVVVGAVPVVDGGGARVSEERPKRGVEKDSIVELRVGGPGLGQKVRVNGGTHSRSGHGISVASICPNGKVSGTLRT